MRVNTNDSIASYDVDGTIITVLKDNPHPDDIISITDPYTGTVKLRTAYMPNIELMKKHKAQGYWIKVWSHGGYKWAEAVVKKLGLADIVDEIEAKPLKYIDDLNASEWMGNPIFVKED
jgi:hypothetical protein